MGSPVAFLKELDGLLAAPTAGPSYANTSNGPEQHPGDPFSETLEEFLNRFNAN